MDQVNGQINAIHNDSIELPDFVGHFNPFNLDELEFQVCRIADKSDGLNDPRLDDKKTHDTTAPQKPSQTKELCSLNQLKNLVHWW